MIQGLPKEAAVTKGSKSPVPREYGQDGGCPGWKTEEGLRPRPLGAWEALGAWRPRASILLKPQRPWAVGSAPHAQVSPPSTLLLFPLLTGPVFLPDGVCRDLLPRRECSPGSRKATVLISACPSPARASPRLGGQKGKEYSLNTYCVCCGAISYTLFPLTLPKPA